MKEINEGVNFWTQHTVENVSDQINNDEKNKKRFIWLFTVYHSKLSRI